MDVKPYKPKKKVKAPAPARPLVHRRPTPFVVTDEVIDPKVILEKLISRRR